MGLRYAQECVPLIFIFIFQISEHNANGFLPPHPILERNAARARALSAYRAHAGRDICIWYSMQGSLQQRSRVRGSGVSRELDKRIFNSLHLFLAAFSSSKHHRDLNNQTLSFSQNLQMPSFLLHRTIEKYINQNIIICYAPQMCKLVFNLSKEKYFYCSLS